MSSDSGHMIKPDQTMAQWNTEFNSGHTPFMGYQQSSNINYPGQSQTMAQKPYGGGD